MPCESKSRSNGPATPSRFLLVAAGILGASGVILGAFGAHGLSEVLDPTGTADPAWLTKRLAQFDTGVRYHLLHAVALLALATTGTGMCATWRKVAAGSWLVGVAVFSGLLYLLVLLDRPVLGAIVPIGGVALILGWAAVVVGALRAPRSKAE